MDIILAPFFQVVHIALELYLYGLILYSIIYLLQALDVLKKQNPIIFKLQTALFSLYEPLLGPIRQAIPLNVDISIVVLYLALHFVKGVIIKIASQFPL